MNRFRLAQKVSLSSTLLTGVAFALVLWIYPELKNALIALGAVFVGSLGGLLYLNRQGVVKFSKTRSAREGTNAGVMILLVFGILVAVNFLAANHPFRKDLTRTKTQSLSDQTQKVIKDLKEDVTVTVYERTLQAQSAKSLLTNYSYLSKYFKFEMVDPDKQVAAARAANIKKYGTAILHKGSKENRIEEINEEKLTNALIKLSKDKNQVLCFTQGHGERSYDVSTQEGYSQVKKDMESSSWDLKTVVLLETKEVPSECTALVMLGVNKTLFDSEIKAVGNYLEKGGRLFLAFDPDVRGGPNNLAQINQILNPWFIKVSPHVIIDPTSRLVGADASNALVQTYNNEIPVVKDFRELTLFPLASSLEIMSAIPTELKVSWVARSTPRALSITDFKSLASGKIQITGQERKGPFDMMVSAVGKQPKSTASAETRILVVGTSMLASNATYRVAGNGDLFLNSLSWLASDDSLISIRSKEESSQAITLSETENRALQLLVFAVVPLLTIAASIFVYIRRRKL